MKPFNHFVGNSHAVTDMDTRRVLIVEDHRGMRNALAGLFCKHGWEVIAVATVAEGLDALDTTPECAVIDLHLPDGEGEAIVRKVRENSLPTCVTVICTASNDEVRIRSVESMRPDAMLRKPVDFEDILSACDHSVVR